MHAVVQVRNLGVVQTSLPPPSYVSDQALLPHHSASSLCSLFPATSHFTGGVALLLQCYSNLWPYAADTNTLTQTLPASERGRPRTGLPLSSPIACAPHFSSWHSKQFELFKNILSLITRITSTRYSISIVLYF